MSGVALQRSRWRADVQPGDILSAENWRTLAAVETSVAAANRAVEAAEAEAKQLRDRAHAEGYAEGRAAGLESVTEELTRLAALSTSLRAGVEREAIALAQTVVKRLMSELDESSVLPRLIEDAVGACDKGSAISVTVNPAMMSIAQAKLERLSQSADVNLPIALRGDEQVGSDACVVESSAGRVEASWARQIAAVERAFQSLAEDEPADPERRSRYA